MLLILIPAAIVFFICVAVAVDDSDPVLIAWGILFAIIAGLVGFFVACGLGYTALHRDPPPQHECAELISMSNEHNYLFHSVEEGEESYTYFVKPEADVYEARSLDADMTKVIEDVKEGEMARVCREFTNSTFWHPFWLDADSHADKYEIHVPPGTVARNFELNLEGYQS